ncbi:hypothetical protein NN561_016627 [Cricetulus griseus]
MKARARPSVRTENGGSRSLLQTRSVRTASASHHQDPPMFPLPPRLEGVRVPPPRIARPLSLFFAPASRKPAPNSQREERLRHDARRRLSKPYFPGECWTEAPASRLPELFT